MPSPTSFDGTVDVIIAAWNCESTIGRAVLSALAEPVVRKVYVVDDGSSDRTAIRAHQIGAGSDRVEVIMLKTNFGPAAARNRALERAFAPWIAILDGDDYLLPGRFERMLAFSAGADAVIDDLLQIEEDKLGHRAPQPMLSPLPFAPWICDFETFVLGNISRKGRDRKELGFVKPLIRRSFLNRHNLRYDEKLRLGEDYALYARALALGARFLVVPPQGYVSVLRSTSLSAKHSKTDLELLRDSDLRLAAFPSLSHRQRLAVKRHRQSIDARIRWLEAIEAVKARRPAQFIGTFFHSYQAAAYVGTRLAEQAYLRLMATGKRVKRAS